MAEDAAVENILKQGYLRRNPSSTNILSGIFRRQEGPKWFVLTVRSGVPYLEQYDADVHVFSRQPLHSFSLAQCSGVRATMGTASPTTFCIVCPDRVLELVASTRQQLVDWVTDLQRCLADLGILKLRREEHVYTVCPAVVKQTQPRVSEEVLEEREAEALTQQSANNSSSWADLSSNNGFSAQPGENGVRGSSTETETLDQLDESVERLSSAELLLEAPPRLPVRARTLGLHGQANTSAEPGGVILRHSARDRTISGSEEREPSPPPLPARPGPAQSRFNSQSSSEEFPHTNSSNDSDFVSPEVIAQIRLSRLVTESEIKEEPTETTAANDLYLSGKNEAGPSFSLVGQDLENLEGATSVAGISFDDFVAIRNSSGGISTTDEDVLSQDKTLSASSSSSSLSFLNLSDDTCTNFVLAAGSSSLNTQENPYSFLPLESDTCADPGLHSEELEMDPDSTSSLRPRPRPRRTLSSPAHMLDSSGKAHSSETQDESGSAFTNWVSFDDPPSQRAPDIPVHTDQSETAKKDFKDENENCYGFMCDASTSPSSAIPPLPPRFDSLPTASQPASLSHAKTDAMPGALPVINGRAIKGDHEPAAPPLPRPRRHTTTTTTSLSHTHSTSSFEDFEIPPIPPRRLPASQPNGSSHNVAKDRPPALPTRVSQSFIIKRPQLTNQASLENGAAGPITSHPGISETGAGNETAAGSANRQSGLSRLMLLDRAHSLHTVVSLKQTQAEILQSEINLPSVALTLTQKSGHGLALVDWNSLPCIVGWNQHDFPSLHGKLHLGDMILSVNGVKVTSSEVAQKLLRGATTPKITVVLHRMPYAKVFAIRRAAEGQSLGIKREGGTGEIVYVDPNGLIAQHGLQPHAQGVVNEEVRCNWFITEINNRAISLFFKENEIEHRLMAVGREISIVVQPSDFIFEIRRQFKKIKNFKNYITK